MNDEETARTLDNALIERLRLIVDDPMWADHVEVTKKLISHVADRLEAAKELTTKARALVALLDDAEVNHGGLYSSKTMRGRDDLRLELSRWAK